MLLPQVDKAVARSRRGHSLAWRGHWVDIRAEDFSIYCTVGNSIADSLQRAVSNKSSQLVDAMRWARGGY